MTATIMLAVLNMAGYSQSGYEIDCLSWTGGRRTSIVIHVLATDGSEFTTGRIELGAMSDPIDAQALIWSALDDSGWVVKMGPNRTVTVFAPKGQAVKSIRFESDGWTPKVRRLTGPPVVPKKP